MVANLTKKVSTFASVAMFLVVLWGVPLLPEAYAGKSEELVAPTPALVFSKIDGNFTDIRQLKLTPLGEQLVSGDGSWMPAHEWEDALAQPQALYLEDSLEEGGAFVRLKYYQRGWIDNNTWLDILIDKPADPQIVWNPGFVTDAADAYFSPVSSDYQDRRGQYLVTFWYMSVTKCNMFANCQRNFDYAPLWYYNRDSWKHLEIKNPVGIANSHVGPSADFPAAGDHVIYEMRICLDALGLGNTFGFAVNTWETVMQNGTYEGRRDRSWPAELARYGFEQGPCSNCYWVPSYWGTSALNSESVVLVRTTTTTLTTERTLTTTAVSTVETQRTDLTALALAVVVSVGVGFAVGHLVGRRRKS